MKDSEFIELLNLYLDHEITAADAARLEAEVLGNPARREIYRDYCRMQKSCKLLAQEFQTDAVPVEDRKIVAFQSARAARRMGVYVAGGFAAAAACVAFIFVSGGRQQLEPTPAAPAAAVAASPVGNNTERTIGRTVSMPAARDQARSPFITTLSLAENPAAVPGSKLLLTTDTGAAQFEWLQNVKFSPLSPLATEPMRLEPKAERRTYDSPEPLREDFESIALRFQK